MAADKIIADWKKGVFKPVYWLEGEEEFFIDEVMQYAEHHILPESEASFNLTVFYGRDASWPDIVNACRRYPMFAERQVVLLKEAQLMRDVDKLQGYVEQPLASTVFVVSYKDKKVDARTKFAKALKEKGVMLTTKKMYDNQLPEWTAGMVRSKGLGIGQKAVIMLVDHIGNDLTRMVHEVDKIVINLGKRKEITEEDIEEYVGVSKEFNVFELQAAISKRDLAKGVRIIQYFESNPKAAPIQLILPALYSFFSKVFMVFGSGGGDEKAMASNIGVSPFMVREYIAASRTYNYQGVERILLLLHQYNLRSVGINNAGAGDGSLMKELLVRIMA